MRKWQRVLAGLFSRTGIRLDLKVNVTHLFARGKFADRSNISRDKTGEWWRRDADIFPHRSDVRLSADQWSEHYYPLPYRYFIAICVGNHNGDLFPRSSQQRLCSSSHSDAPAFWPFSNLWRDRRVHVACRRNVVCLRQKNIVHRWLNSEYGAVPRGILRLIPLLLFQKSILCCKRISPQLSQLLMTNIRV